MIGEFLKGTRDFIQLIILLLLLMIFFKLWNIPSFGDLQNWIDYRTAIAYIDRKGSLSLGTQAERFIFRIRTFGRDDKGRAIHLLCKLAKKGKEEAELLLLIYDMEIKQCPESKL